MKLKHYPDQGYGPSVSVELSGNEVALAIMAYLVARDVHVCGPQTIRVNGEIITGGSLYVGPSGYLIKGGSAYPTKAKE